MRSSLIFLRAQSQRCENGGQKAVGPAGQLYHLWCAKEAENVKELRCVRFSKTETGEAGRVFRCRTSVRNYRLFLVLSTRCV